MAKRWWNQMCVRWLGAAAIGAAVLVAAPRGVRGQRAQPEAAAIIEATRLNDEVERLYGEGKWDSAIPLAERALAIREKALGPEHPHIATSLNNLAALYT